MFTNPKRQEFAKDVFESTLEQRGGKDIKRGLEFINRNIIEKFSRGKVGIVDLRDWFSRLGKIQKKEGYGNENWDTMCRNERGQNEIGELLFQFRLEMANLYRKTNKELES